MNHVMHKSLFDKQKLQASIQNSQNQAKIPKIPEFATLMNIQSCEPLDYV